MHGRGASTPRRAVARPRDGMDRRHREHTARIVPGTAGQARPAHRLTPITTTGFVRGFWDPGSDRTWRLSGCFLFVGSDRGLAGCRGSVGVFAEEELAVVAAEEEGEAVQVGAEGVRAVGGVADEGEQRGGKALGVGGQPAGDELEGLGELDGVGGVDAGLGHGGAGVSLAGRRGPGRGGRSRCRSR